MRLSEKETVLRSLFTWEYIANSILGKHVRKKVKARANIERNPTTRNIYQILINLWCNTVSAPPVKEGEANT